MTKKEDMGEFCPKYIEDELNLPKNAYPTMFIDTIYDRCGEGLFDDDTSGIDRETKKRWEEGNLHKLKKLKGDYYEVVDRIKETKQGEPIYRGLIIQNYKKFIKELNNEKNYKNVGEYWAWDERCARPSGQCGSTLEEEHLVILKGINPTEIDELGTYETNIRFENDEKEIRLKKGSHIFIEEVCYNRKNKINEIKRGCIKIGKYFKV